jgi:hypothetical protein
LADGIYQFPIATVEEGETYSCCSSDGIANIDDVVTIELSHDLGDTTRC